jgi:hypothetical protein
VGLLGNATMESEEQMRCDQHLGIR